MERRSFFKAALAGGVMALAGKGIVFAERYFPIPVDEDLFKDINRVEDWGNATKLQEKHAPLIEAPGRVTAGKPFSVDVTVGKILHPMGTEHWIEYIHLNVGNQPAGMITFRSHGYLNPTAKFEMVLGKDLKGKKVSLIAQEKCNLHGLWENYVNVEVI